MRLPVLPCAKSRYRAVHAAMPTSSIHFTPSRAKNHGITSMKPISDIWPSVIFPAAFSMPISLRNRFAKA